MQLRTRQRSKHLFLKKALERARPTIFRAATEAIKARQEQRRLNTVAVSEEEVYHAETHRYADALDQVPERLDSVRLLLMHVPTKAYLRRVKMSATDHVHYHHRMHVFLLSAAFDTALNLCNVLLRLDIPPYAVREKDVAKHPRVKRFGLKTKLKAIAALVKPHKPLRQDVLHHGQQNVLESFERIVLLELAQKGSRRASDRFVVPPGIMDAMRGDATAELLIPMWEERRALRAAIDDLFAALDRPYDIFTGLSLTSACSSTSGGVLRVC